MKASKLSLTKFLAIFLASGTVASAQTLYWGGGSADIADNTTIPTTWSSLNGTWNTTAKNFANTPNSPNTYQAWTQNATFRGSFNYSANNTTEVAAINIGSNISSPSLNFGLGLAGNFVNKRVQINAASAANLTLTGAAPTIDVRANGTDLRTIDTVSIDINGSGSNVSLQGSNGFTKTGNYGLRIFGNQNALTGTVNILHNTNFYADQSSAGFVQVGTNTSINSTMSGVTRFNVSAANNGVGGATSFGGRGRLIVVNTAAGANQINDSAVINLAGLGEFQYDGRLGTTETVGQLSIASSGVLNMTSQSSGTGTLTFTNGIGRADNRTQLLVRTVNTTGAFASTVNLGSSHGLGTNVLLPWATDGTQGRFLQVDASNNLIAVTATDTSDVSTITSSATNYRVTGNSTVITGGNATFASGAAANTLGFYRGNGGGAVTVNVTDTLTIAGGGISIGNDGGTTNVTIQNGTSITTSGTTPLFISTGTSSAFGDVTISTPITGAIDVVKAGVSPLKFTGSTANTYSGTTYVNGGELNLSKTAGVNAIAGNVVVRNGGVLYSTNSNQIADTSTVTVENGGYFQTAGTTETIGYLTGGGMVLATSTGITTVKNGVTVGDNGIGTMIMNRSGTGAFTMNATATFNLQVAGNGGTPDQMLFYNYASGKFALNSNAINLTLSGAEVGGTYTVSLFKFFSDSGTTLTSSGITSGLTIGTLGSGFDGTPTLSYNSGGNSIDLTYTVVPEPSTWALLAVSLTVVVVFRRRRA